ncbi:methyltransferase domain-containing protein [Phytoactinopolyspora sp. XMNu-373]|uniref:Methyltransferase domain-containing protein n=1 Tax=Phytoactinopolyspora mesophila TaxID=2650750 RepID=A0A7K3M403_9ACTN|nr:methyltransferase domain-containing protein [Phytoactinopolyspora mesophila]
MDPAIRDHYVSRNERDRLTAGAGLVEFLRTQELLGRVLPSVPAVVLDVGGGAGIHAAPLAQQGYEVHLIDAVPLHVEQAREIPDLASASTGDARELAWPDDSVDAVLLLGPLYHLTERADRVRALAEARRVLRTGGVVAAAAISRYASTLGGLFRGQLRHPGFEAIVERDLIDGQHRNPDDVPEWFTTAYFHEPRELMDEASDAGLVDTSVLAVEGPAAMLPDVDRWLADDRDLLMRAIRRVEAAPALLGVSPHVLLCAYAA